MCVRAIRAGAKSGEGLGSDQREPRMSSLRAGLSLVVKGEPLKGLNAAAACSDLCFMDKD